MEFSNAGSFKEIDYYKVKAFIYYLKALDILFSYSTVETLKN